MSQSRKFLIVGTDRCGSTLLSAIIAKSGGYLVSMYRKSGGDYAKWRGVWMNVNASVLLQASTYPAALVSCEELMDPNESDWATRLHELTGNASPDDIDCYKGIDQAGRNSTR